MHPVWISVTVCIAILFITLGIGSNAALKTKNRSSMLAVKFGSFMAISHFCFYYIGILVTKPLFPLLKDMRLGVVAILMLTMCIKTVWNVFSYKAEDNYYNLSKTPIQLYLSLAGGINALLCGMALTLSGALHLNTAALIALGAFLGGFTGAGFSPRIAATITRLRPALAGAALFLALAVFYFLRFRSIA